jgi:hypothetical protein
MNTRNLAALIERYLEGDDGADDGSNGSSNAVSNIDSSLRMQVRELTQRNAELQQEMVSLRNNLQMSTLLPLLTTPQVIVSSHTNADGSPSSSDITGDILDLEPADPLSSLLPILLLSGTGSSGNSGTSDSSNMLLLLALSGGL